MNPALWSDILADVASAERHFQGTIALVDAGAFSGGEFELYRGQMAVMHAMQSAHTSVEAALRRLLEILDEPAPTGAESHADLIRRVRNPLPGARPAIVSGELADALDLTRKFRHVAMRAYDTFNPLYAMPAIEAAHVVVRLLRPELEAFRDSLYGP